MFEVDFIVKLKRQQKKHNSNNINSDNLTDDET